MTSRISINNIDAILDETTGAFKIERFNLGLQTNDLVVKTFNINGSISSKQVYTVYYAGGSDRVTLSAISATGTQSDTASYGADATQFGFTFPSSSGKFATTGSEITIRGFTTAKGISKVLVDGFELKSFNGSTWRYHAFTRFNNLKLGNNEYQIQYFGEDGSVVYTDKYTLVKKVAGSIVPAKKVEEVVSDEV